MHCEKLGVSLHDANLGESKTIYWLEWKDASSSESKQKTKFCNPNKLVIQGETAALEQLNDMHIAWVTDILPQDMTFRSQMVLYPLFTI